ncbi:radical SAM family heme chaperone HemW [Desulfuromonas carbonis]|uniref:radical SAM family heme chaperone HemW n=1 Tax=Desulfuromonas sp. DDH964 TaxID=1823759 RepID=UPI00078CED97|nr:radical SAM family heme chaperone HemW [Desulfuromonas sp. DDH964]AMV70783.1 oxygen-independent coproporphyrinogen III oxidase [Desulfuromonas sp. DDH964]
MAGLYFHIPYCRSKCAYCDFFSLADAALPLADYVTLLHDQLALTPAQWSAPAPLASVFFGGGTPSLLEPKAVAGLLAAAERRFGFAPGVEISLEANPGTVTPASLADYRAAGVNRLSLGLQSLNDFSLAFLGRGHSAAQGRQACAWARRAGFDNLSCDLIFGLPGETEASLDAEVTGLLELAPEHLSCYGLSVEAGTPLATRLQRGEFLPADEGRFAAGYRQLDAALTAAGLVHYEVSNFARPGRECRHNLGYWQRRSVVGVGAGAHSFIADGWGRRLAVAPDLAGYAAALRSGQDPATELEQFDRRGAMAETLYLGLRTAAGVDDAAFQDAFGSDVASAFPAALRRCGQRLSRRQGRWVFDLDGWLLYDHLISAFL